MYNSFFCLICDEPLKLTASEWLGLERDKNAVCVCDACKAAVKRMRQEEFLRNIINTNDSISR